MLQNLNSPPPLAKKYYDLRKAIRARFEETALNAQPQKRLALPKPSCPLNPGPGSLSKYQVQAVPVVFTIFVPCSRAQPPAPYAKCGRAHNVKLSAIKQATAAFYGVTVDQLISRQRKQAIMRPRQVACFLGKTLGQNSLPEIARHMGGRDHTTILHAIRKIQSRMETDEKLAADIEYLTRSLSFKREI